MKIRHGFHLIVLGILTVALSIAAEASSVDDFFNRGGSVLSDFVAAGIRFEIPTYYAHDTSLDYDGLKSFACDDAYLYFYYGKVVHVDTEEDAKQYGADFVGIVAGTDDLDISYGKAEIAGLDSTTAYATTPTTHIYVTVTSLPDGSGGVVTTFASRISDTADQYESDYVTMLQNATLAN